MATHRTVPVVHAGDHRSTALTPRGTATLAILRAQDLTRDLDAADREYLASYVADLLVDLCIDTPHTSALP